MVAAMYESERRKRISIAVAAFAVLAFAAPATALDVWSAPYTGVRMMHRTGGGIDVHIVLVDLANPDVSLVATRPADRMITVSEFARRYEADIAINANFFDRGSCGLMVGDGELMESAYSDNCIASMAFGRENEAAVFDSLNALRGPVPARWMTEVLSGKPFLMRDGRALTNWVRPQHLYRPNPRSALGLTADRRTLVILAADGRRRGVLGLTGFQMVQLFREFDVTDAINLDGGGSTALVAGGRVRNQPSDGQERTVLSHFGVRVRPGARWQAAEITGGGAPLTTREGEAASIWIEARNVGRSTWYPDNVGLSSPVLDLDDGAVGYIANVSAPTPPGAVGRFAVDWHARGGGARHLRARLHAPDGSVLAGAALAWDVAVERVPHGRTFVPQRALAIAHASEVSLPAGLGAVFVGTRGCIAGPISTGSRARPAWLLALAAIAAVAARRTKRDNSRS